MLTRRDACKIITLSPILICTNAEAFWPLLLRGIPLIVRFLAGRTVRSLGSNLVRTSIRASSRVAPRISTTSSRTRLSANSYEVELSEREKMRDFINKVDTTIDVADGAQGLYRLWNGDSKNSATLILANPSGETINTDKTTVRMVGDNTNGIPAIEIPATKIDPEKGLMFQFDYENLPSGRKNFQFDSKGSASKLYDEILGKDRTILVADNNDYNKISSEIKRNPSAGSASKLYEKILGY